MAETMVERVARAIEATMFAPHELPVTSDLHAKFLETARFAIAAMRELSEAMDLAGCFDLAVDRTDATSVWRAMIDAALTEEPSP